MKPGFVLGQDFFRVRIDPLTGVLPLLLAQGYSAQIGTAEHVLEAFLLALPDTEQRLPRNGSEAVLLLVHDRPAGQIVPSFDHAHALDLAGCEPRQIVSQDGRIGLRFGRLRNTITNETHDGAVVRIGGETTGWHGLARALALDVATAVFEPLR